MFRSQRIIIREYVCTSLKLLNYLKNTEFKILKIIPGVVAAKRVAGTRGDPCGAVRLTQVPKVAPSTSLFGSCACRKFTTWDRRLYFPSEGRRAGDFFARKFRRLRPVLNPRTWVSKASMLTSRPPKPLNILKCVGKIRLLCCAIGIVQYIPFSFKY